MDDVLQNTKHRANDASKGKVQKKNSKKKLTNVSFAFTHTYTLVKTNIFGIFSQACLENVEKCVKTPKKNWYKVREGGLGCYQPLVTKMPP